MLWSDFLSHQGRRSIKWSHYFPAYERHLARFRNQSVTVFEIGVAYGGSAQLLKKYLGPLVQIVGLDIMEECREMEEEQISIRIGDQSDTAFLQSVIDEFGPPDIVIDDGSHLQPHVNATFDFLYPLTDKNGLYAVEDLHTAYWASYGGGLRKPDTFIERAKGFIDELHAETANSGGLADLPVTEFRRSTLSMHVYDSLVIFERGVPPKLYMPTMGAEPPTASG